MKAYGSNAPGVLNKAHIRRPSSCPPRGRTDSEANELSAAVWIERRHLTELIVLLNKSAASMPERGKPVTPATVKQKVQELRIAGLARAAAADTLSRVWGMSDEPTLPEVIVHAHVQPWVFIFSSHLDAMEDLLNQIEHSRSCSTHGTCATGTHTSMPLPPTLIPRALRQFIRGPE